MSWTPAETPPFCVEGQHGGTLQPKQTSNSNQENIYWKFKIHNAQTKKYVNRTTQLICDGSPVLESIDHAGHHPYQHLKLFSIRTSEITTDFRGHTVIPLKHETYYEINNEIHQGTKFVLALNHLDDSSKLCFPRHTFSRRLLERIPKPSVTPLADIAPRYQSPFLTDSLHVHLLQHMPSK